MSQSEPSINKVLDEYDGVDGSAEVLEGVDESAFDDHQGSSAPQSSTPVSDVPPKKRRP